LRVTLWGSHLTFEDEELDLIEDIPTEGELTRHPFTLLDIIPVPELEELVSFGEIFLASVEDI
jgi:hypothetical protein